MSQLGTGTTITFSTGFFAEITSVAFDLTREAIDSTHMGTTGTKTKLLSSLVEVGDLAIELFFDPAAEPPITAAAEAIVVTFPDGSTLTGTGGLTNFSLSAVVDEQMTASAVLTWSTGPAWA